MFRKADFKSLSVNCQSSFSADPKSTMSWSRAPATASLSKDLMKTEDR